MDLIFKYLYYNKVTVEPEIWLHTIHCDNPELIDFLKEKNISLPDESYNKCFEEAIKCHHNETANYILNNYIKETLVHPYGFHYHNYSFFPNQANSFSTFLYACYYNYVQIVLYFLQNTKINALESVIPIFFYE